MGPYWLKVNFGLGMAWCHQATSHYLSQCWPRYMWPYGMARSHTFWSIFPSSFKMGFVNCSTYGSYIPHIILVIASVFEAVLFFQSISEAIMLDSWCRMKLWSKLALVLLSWHFVWKLVLHNINVHGQRKCLLQWDFSFYLSPMKPGDECTFQETSWSLVQVMVCLLFSTKSLPEQIHEGIMTWKPCPHHWLSVYMWIPLQRASNTEFGISFVVSFDKMINK